MTIYISNLSIMTTAIHLSNLFVEFGRVLSAKISIDKTGHSMGFGYIVMDEQSGRSAINGLNSLNFMNHYIEVSEARV